MYRTPATLLAAMILFPAAASALPPDHIVTYSFRETPSDSLSNTLIVAKLHIAARSQNGDDVTWKINELEFVEIASGDRWTQPYPSLPDWVVTHADPDNPVPTDFVSPPALSGTAAARMIEGDDLDYDVVPGTCDTLCESLFDGRVIAAKYRFATANKVIAEEKDDDEPAETDFEEDPS